MPGIENFAPDRTDTSSGFSVDPSVAPAAFSSFLMFSAICASTAGGNLALLLVVERADVGGDREARRHRQAGVGHLGEAGALAAERVAHAAIAVGLPVAEEVDVLRGLPGLSSSVLPSSPFDNLSRLRSTISEMSAMPRMRSRSAATSASRACRSASSSAITSTSSKNFATAGCSAAMPAKASR